MSEITLYDQAKQALVQYQEVDEVKDFRDKAKAMEEYARQAQDRELEKAAAVARLRAERRWGELYKQSEKAEGAKGNPNGRGAPIVRSNETTTQPKTLNEMNVSKDQSSNWQKLADIPEKEFEEIITAPCPPSTAKQINEMRKPPKPVPKFDQRVVWLFGEANDGMWYEFIKAHKLSDVLPVVPQNMRYEIDVFLTDLRDWINEKY